VCRGWVTGTGTMVLQVGGAHASSMGVEKPELVRTIGVEVHLPTSIFLNHWI
jgi:hypothetical protein